MQDDPRPEVNARRPLAFHSARFSDAEKNYPVGEQELLAVMSALKKWRCCLEGAKGGVTVITDHLPNTFLSTKSTEQFSRRQARWQLELSRFDLQWIYEKGNSNLADPLSRCPAFLSIMRKFKDAFVPECLSTSADPQLRSMEIDTRVSDQPPEQPDYETRAEVIMSDGGPAILAVTSKLPDPEGIQGIVQSIADMVYNGMTEEEQYVMRQSAHYSARNGLWYYGDLIFVPENEALRKHCIAVNHNLPSAGNLGRNVTLELVQRHFWWPTIRKDVAAYVAACPSSQLNKASTQKPAGLLQPLPIPDYPWQSVSMDLITQLPCTARGHTAIVVFVDRLTKMVHFIPTQTKLSAIQFAHLFVDKVFCRHGLPETIVSDRDPRFTAAFFKEICRLLGMKQSMSTAFHPQTDGQTERTNRTLEEMLRHFVGPSQDDWDLKLPCAEFAVNNSMKAATGSTPFFLNHGRHPRGPASIDLSTDVPAAGEFVEKLNSALSRARDSLAAAQARMKNNADPKRKDIELAVGDEFLLNTRNLRLKLQGTRKFIPRFIGPYLIKKKVGRVSYELDLKNELGRIHPVFHISLLRPYDASSGMAKPPSPVMIDGEPEWPVERILDHRDHKISEKSRRTRRSFLVKWAGYGHEQNSWEEESDCKNCKDLIQDYYASVKYGSELQQQIGQ